MQRFPVLILAVLLAGCTGGGGGGGGHGVGLEDLDGDGQIVILAFGDSITRGQGDGDSPDDIPPANVAGYPARLQAATGVLVFNAGRPGEQTSAGKARLRNLLQQSSEDYVVLLEGANDIERRNDGEALQNLQSMIEMVFADGAMPMIGTLTPSCCNHTHSVPANHVIAFNDQVRAMAQSNGIPLVDFNLAFVPDQTLPFDETSGLIHVEEGLHPTSAGYDLMAKTVLDVFLGG